VAAADVSDGLSSSLGSGCSSSFVDGDVFVCAVGSTVCFSFIHPMNCSTESWYGIGIPIDLANLRSERN